MSKIKDMKEYCLNCINKPCQKGCPLSNDIPSFINSITMEEAVSVLYKTTVLSSICGRICPHTKQCQGKCTRNLTHGKPVSIGEVEAAIGDFALENDIPLPLDIDEKLSTKKVAIIGGGPSGLTCASFLARKGIKVTIYEKREKLGGLLRYGIPEFRLPKTIVDKVIDKILSQDIEVRTNQELSKDFFIEELSKKYDAVAICIGANIHSKAYIENEDAPNVYGANEMLETEVFPNFKGKKVAILGGGNVAMDAARTIIRKNAKEVYIIYRRSEAEMPAETEEIEAAKKDGVKFMLQNNIVSVLPNKIICIKTKLVQKEGDSRPSPINIEGSEYELPMDIVVLATGSKTNKDALEGIELTDRGYIKIQENKQAVLTNSQKNNIFAAGDVAGDKATVAAAAYGGREVANNIIEYL